MFLWSTSDQNRHMCAQLRCPTKSGSQNRKGANLTCNRGRRHGLIQIGKFKRKVRTVTRMELLRRSLNSWHFYQARIMKSFFVCANVTAFRPEFPQEFSGTPPPVARPSKPPYVLLPAPHVDFPAPKELGQGC